MMRKSKDFDAIADDYLAAPISSFKGIYAQFDGKCPWCGEAFKRSDYIAWSPSGGSAHQDCVIESHGPRWRNA